MYSYITLYMRFRLYESPHHITSARRIDFSKMAQLNLRMQQNIVQNNFRFTIKNTAFCKKLRNKCRRVRNGNNLMPQPH
jgi:hypothetical protein